MKPWFNAYVNQANETCAKNKTNKNFRVGNAYTEEVKNVEMTATIS